MTIGGMQMSTMNVQFVMGSVLLAEAMCEEDMKLEGTHLKFVPGPPKPKTKTWWVVNKHDDIHLGWIGWFGRWRKYAFFPKEETVYEQVCLRDIADFCETATKEHREARKKKNENL